MPGKFMRASAIAAAGIVLSHPTTHTTASNICPRQTSSIESAISSRLTNDARMPSVPIVSPSEIAMVLNSIGVPPAAEGNATGWYAYVTQPAGSVFTRQQAVGSPTAIGSNLVLTTTPTLTGANPLATNTATLPPVTGCTSYYPNLYAWELQYAPYGVDSGLCVGVATTAVSGE